MHTESFLFFRVLGAIGFILAAGAGVFLIRNHQRLFAPDSDMPSENASSRTYAKVLVFAVWAHLLFFTGAAALLAE